MVDGCRLVCVKSCINGQGLAWDVVSPTSTSVEEEGEKALDKRSGGLEGTRNVEASSPYSALIPRATLLSPSNM